MGLVCGEMGILLVLGGGLQILGAMRDVHPSFPHSDLRVDSKGWVNLSDCEINPFAAAAWMSTLLPHAEAAQRFCSLLAAVTGKEQLCRCSAAWLKAPALLFLGDISGAPTHYLLCELSARIWAHWRTVFFSAALKKNKIKMLYVGISHTECCCYFNLWRWKAAFFYKFHFQSG